MAEQTSTPGSTAETSVNGSSSKVLATPKDKACPFCSQPFTSSSLGRHLDLYIKEKNPKPADGIHDVDQIRKLRGNITRRQPRNSISRRDDSTPRGTPGLQDAKSPQPDGSSHQGQSEGSRRRDEGASGDTLSHGKTKYLLNKASWETTGVINNLPYARNGDSGHGWEGDERDAARRVRSVSRQALAKNTFEQKQKMVEAMDNARAAELALREVLLSIRAAKQRIEGPQIFNYDPLTLSFPALVLHCLPPPPTIQQSTPLPCPTSWFLTPPNEPQYQALLSHFSTTFSNWRISCAIATTAPQDDHSYPPPLQLDDYAINTVDDNTAAAQRAEAEAADLETKIMAHIRTAYNHWDAIPSTQKAELWTLELARSIGRKSEEIDRLKREKELSQQETEHLRLQVDDLSRLQQPREFRFASPKLMPVDKKEMARVGEAAMCIARNRKTVGWDLIQREVQIGEAVERNISRWRDVVKSAREKAGGMAAQRSFSTTAVMEQSVSESDTTPPTNPDAEMEVEEPANQARDQDLAQNQHHETPSAQQEPPNPPPITTNSTAPTAPMTVKSPASTSHSHSQHQPQPHPPSLSRMNTSNTLTSEDALGSDADADADADADMEEDEGYAGMNGGMNDGDGSGRMEMDIDGIENHKCVNGYVRIGA